MKFMKLGSKPDTFQRDGNDVRFVATELATDIIVTVGGIKFYLHKFPLLSKSALLQRLVAAASNESSDEIYVADMPGGANAFEICAKFCYGMTVTLNAYNVVAARCASEQLEMHESLEKGNLIYKIDVFLNSSILRSWKDSIISLQTTKSLLPWTENLKMISRCVDAIACRACIDTSKVEWSYTYNGGNLASENGLDPNWNGVRKRQVVPKDWWVEDLCDLDMEFYKRVVVAIKGDGRMPGKVIGEALKAYACRRIPGVGSDLVRNGGGGESRKQRSLLETIIWLLPTEVGSVRCAFLLKLLRAAITLDCGEICKKELVARIGRQLEEASVSDLLIPSTGETTMYEVEMVAGMVEEFVMQEHGSACTTDEVRMVRSPLFVSDASKVAVARLIDGYLAEIARDPNLPLSGFVDLAEMVSGFSRPVHDALYRAIDMYLKEHPSLSKAEKKRICRLMDCKKLSMDACAHAVQNERLPLRVVVQVLFFRQVRGTTPADHPMTSGSLVPQDNNVGGSNASSKSAATTEDDWDAPDTNKSANHRDGNGGGRAKGMLTPKKMLGKIWSMKNHGGGENSSSDTSESPGSTNLQESKSTLSRNTRNSVS